MFDSSVYRSPQTTEAFHGMIRDLYEYSQKTQPTPFHNLLESLAKSDRLLRLYTQNVDSLDTRHENLRTIVPVPPAAPWPKVIAVHGSLAKMTCTKCQIIKDFNPELFRIWAEDTPECNECKKAEERRIAAGRRRLGVGFIRPRMVLYGEPGYDDLNIGSCMASDLRNRPDALIVVGTTLKIPGTRTMVKEMSKAIGNRGHIIWLNVDDAPAGEFGDVWDFVIKGDCQEVARLMEGIPITHKDQSFCVEEPFNSSQQTVRDVEQKVRISEKSPFWHVVNSSNDPGNGLLTPASTLASTSDDEKPLLAVDYVTNLSHRAKDKPENMLKKMPKTTDPATFYRPLNHISHNNELTQPLKRKRAIKDVKTSSLKSTKKAVLNSDIVKIPKKRGRKPKSTVITLKLTPTSCKVLDHGRKQTVNNQSVSSSTSETVPSQENLPTSMVESSLVVTPAASDADTRVDDPSTKHVTSRQPTEPTKELPIRSIDIASLSSSIEPLVPPPTGGLNLVPQDESTSIEPHKLSTVESFEQELAQTVEDTRGDAPQLGSIEACSASPKSPTGLDSTDSLDPSRKEEERAAESLRPSVPPRARKRDRWVGVEPVRRSNRLISST